MNVKDYRYIVEIAEQKSISKAAAVLYITQSALTRFLQRVEEELGASLFFRQGNHLALTEVGQCYVERGRKIIELDYEAEEEISKIIQQKKQYLRIGYGFGRTDHITKAVLKPFLETYRDVQVDVRLGSAESRLKLVEKNELDLAIVTSRDYRPGLVYCQVGRAPLVLAVPSHSRLQNRGDVIPHHRAVGMDRRAFYSAFRRHLLRKTYPGIFQKNADKTPGLPGDQ